MNGVVLISGIRGAGKATIAGGLPLRLIVADEIQNLIVVGGLRGNRNPATS